MVRIFIGLIIFQVLFALTDIHAEELLNFETEPILYSRTEPENSLTNLQQKIDEGTSSLSYDSNHGYLSAILSELEVSPTSQLLVFSKTSVQRAHITPKTPRAIYFNDDLYVAVVPGGFLEFIVPDPKLGLAFYRLDQNPEQVQFKQEIARCMTCHSSSRTRNIPGLQARSMFVDPAGMPVVSAGSFRTTQASPLSERWGGWYVTGTHGTAQHMGNFHLPDNKRPRKPIINETGLNQVELATHFDLKDYITPHSDIVALMVFEHQLDMHNQFSRIQYAWRIAKHESKPEEYWKNECDTLLQQMLFVDEVKLTDPVAGTSGFAEYFAALGPENKGRHSLRQFNLSTRLFEYPCSYMIYSDSFDMLPQPAQEYIYVRLHELLHTTEIPESFERLRNYNRPAIARILMQTKPDLATIWNELE
ncbi:MAG: hypothetical protein KDA65_07535 [Planctomycetaceae bacterium]|nr:hypothetical protein [Planctomycetaceae bacterium]